MRITKFLFVLFLLVSFVLPKTANSEGAVVLKDGTQWLSLYGETVASESVLSVVTPSGNMLMKIVWHLDPDNEFLPEQGVDKVALAGPYGMIDLQAMVYPSGKVVVVAHLNGSGTITPNPGND